MKGLSRRELQMANWI